MSETTSLLFRFPAMEHRKNKGIHHCFEQKDKASTENRNGVRTSTVSNKFLY
jgi:hypothetical protein